MLYLVNVIKMMTVYHSPFRKSISGSFRLKIDPPLGALLCLNATIFEVRFFIISSRYFFSFSCCAFSISFNFYFSLISVMPDLIGGGRGGIGNLTGLILLIGLLYSDCTRKGSFLNSVFSLNLT